MRQYCYISRENSTRIILIYTHTHTDSEISLLFFLGAHTRDEISREIVQYLDETLSRYSLIIAYSRWPTFLNYPFPPPSPADRSRCTFSRGKRGALFLSATLPILRCIEFVTNYHYRITGFCSQPCTRPRSGISLIY